MAAPLQTLNNGYKVPVFGLGTWQSAPGEVGQAVKDAIDCGYRHIDCAFVYENEKEIGDALQEVLTSGKVAREELFITTKLWNTCHRSDLVIPACKGSLDRLQIDYIDLYLVHWPFAYKEDQQELFPVDDKGKVIYSDIDYLDTWKEMEKCVEMGLVKSIGVSNFNSEQIERLLSSSKIKPVMNQIEAHPNLNNKRLINFCKERNIEITAYSPLGSPARPWAKPGDPVLRLSDERLIEIAKKYNKTVPQIIFRYLIHIGTIPIPKSSNKKRIQENINIFDFQLTKDEIDFIDTFDCNGRICPAEGMEDHKYYPFKIPF